MSDALDVWIIHVPLEGVPPGESLHTAPNHQPVSVHICAGLDAFLIGHALRDPGSIQVGPIHPDPTTDPLFWLPPTVVGHDMALKVRNALVLLSMFASEDRALEA